MDKTNVNVVT